MTPLKGRVPLKIGTRSSKLALAQAKLVKAALEKAHPGVICELVVVKTSGDDFGDSPRGDTLPHRVSPSGTFPLKGLFVKEIEEALLEGRLDLGVHSVKDLQTELPEGLALTVVLRREDSRDALVSREGQLFDQLPAGARVGASSLRRQAQLKRLRRDLEFVPIRGNVDTRLRKLDEGQCDALVLAACGLIRLGLEGRITQVMDPAQMLPAPGQGALGLEIRSDRLDIEKLLGAVDDPDSHWAIRAERALLKAMGGSCQVPIGALGRIQGGQLTLTGAVFSPDGLKQVRKEISGPKQAAERLGSELASHLRALGADRLLFGHWTAK